MWKRVWHAVVNLRKVLWSPQTAMRLIHSVPKQLCTWRWLCFTEYFQSLAQHKGAQFWHCYKLKSLRSSFFPPVFRASSACLLSLPSLTLAVCLFPLFFHPLLWETRGGAQPAIKISFGYKFKSQILFLKHLLSLIRSIKSLVTAFGFVGRAFIPELYQISTIKCA